jgi:4-amino-4-deoxy-L-arabinose transferase-like glycosyltransferase
MASLNFRLGCRALRHYRLWVALVMILGAWNCLWRLSSTVVSDLDEARYGVASSEMLRSHSVLVATYAGRPECWNLKPPLGYWMQELAFKFLGPTVFALRLPSALCALILIGLTIRISRRWYGPRQALLAGLVIASSRPLWSRRGNVCQDRPAACCCSGGSGSQASLVERRTGESWRTAGITHS